MASSSLTSGELAVESPIRIEFEKEPESGTAAPKQAGKIRLSSSTDQLAQVLPFFSSPSHRLSDAVHSTSIEGLVTALKSRAAKLISKDEAANPPSGARISLPRSSLAPPNSPDITNDVPRSSLLYNSHQKRMDIFASADLHAQMLIASDVEKRMKLFDIDDSLARAPEGLLILDSSNWRAQITAVMEKEGREFQLKVEERMLLDGGSKLAINAVFDIYTDIIAEDIGNVDAALLWVLQQTFSEFCINNLCKRLLENFNCRVLSALRGTMNSPLHIASAKGYHYVVKDLLEHKAPVNVTNAAGKMPLEVAVNNCHDKVATLLVKHMQSSIVRQLFQGSRNITCRLSLHNLIDNPNMVGTVLAVLDAMIEPIEGHTDKYLVHYSILDADQEGRAPNDPLFNKKEKSCLHVAATRNNKEVVYHDVVRLLLRKKWKSFAKTIFFIKFLFYLLTVLTLAIALFLATAVEDPREYLTRLDPLRLISEIILFCLITFYGISEINELRIHKYDYFRDLKNYMDVASIVLFLLIIPFRISNSDVQWVFASLTFLFYGFRAFEYAAVFRATGAYVRILWVIFQQDLFPFLCIYIVILVSFSGAYFFASGGLLCHINPRDPLSIEDCIIASNASNATADTVDFFRSLVIGMKLGISADFSLEPVFNEHRWLSEFFFYAYLFVVVVVLLNLLIAQMSDTYANVQQDAQRSLAIDRAWIVARVEHNSIIGIDFRQRFYESSEVYENPHDLLEKWEVPPLSQVNKQLDKLDRTLRKQDDAVGELRSILLAKFHEQEEDIKYLRTLLNRMSSQHT